MKHAVMSCILLEVNPVMLIHKGENSEALSPTILCTKSLGRFPEVCNRSCRNRSFGIQALDDNASDLATGWIVIVCSQIQIPEIGNTAAISRSLFCSVKRRGTGHRSNEVQREMDIVNCSLHRTMLPASSITGLQGLGFRVLRFRLQA